MFTLFLVLLSVIVGLVAGWFFVPAPDMAKTAYEWVMSKIKPVPPAPPAA